MNKVHPTTIMAGYRMAMKEAIRYIKVSWRAWLY